MKSPQEYYEQQRKKGLTKSITTNPKPDYTDSFYQDIFKLMKSYGKEYSWDLAKGVSDKENQIKELKDLIQELFSYHPNTRGYDEVRKEILKRINKD